MFLITTDKDPVKKNEPKEHSYVFRRQSFIRYLAIVISVTLSVFLLISIMIFGMSADHIGNTLLVWAAGLVAGLFLVYALSQLLRLYSGTKSILWGSSGISYIACLIGGSGSACLQVLLWEELGLGIHFRSGWLESIPFIIVTGITWINIGLIENWITEREIQISENLVNLEGKIEELNLSRQRIVHVEEEVRRGVAEKIHGPIQMRLLLLERQLQDIVKDDINLPADLQQQLSDVCFEIDKLLTEDLRHLCQELHPSIIHLGLPAAIASICDHSSGDIEFNIAISDDIKQIESPDGSHFQTGIRLVIYRFVQEAVNNIVKHSKADKAMIKLWQSADRIHVLVEDNGIGFLPEEVKTGLGAATMRDYVMTRNGAMEVLSYPGKGTTVIAHLPLANSILSD